MILAEGSSIIKRKHLLTKANSIYTYIAVITRTPASVTKIVHKKANNIYTYIAVITSTPVSVTKIVSMLLFIDWI